MGGAASRFPATCAPAVRLEDADSVSDNPLGGVGPGQRRRSMAPVLDGKKEGYNPAPFRAQDVVRPARRRSRHDLDSDPVAAHGFEQRGGWEDVTRSGSDDDDFGVPLAHPLQRGGTQISGPRFSCVRREDAFTEQDRSGANGRVHGDESGAVRGDPVSTCAPLVGMELHAGCSHAGTTMVSPWTQRCDEA